MQIGTMHFITAHSPPRSMTGEINGMVDLCPMDLCSLQILLEMEECQLGGTRLLIMATLPTPQWKMCSWQLPWTPTMSQMEFTQGTSQFFLLPVH